MDNALASSLVHCAHCVKISCVSSDGIAGRQCRIKLFNGGFHFGSFHTVTKVLLRSDTHTLKSGLMVCQFVSPPIFYSNDGYYNMRLREMQVFNRDISTVFFMFIRNIRAYYK